MSKLLAFGAGEEKKELGGLFRLDLSFGVRACLQTEAGLGIGSGERDSGILFFLSSIVGG